MIVTILELRARILHFLQKFQLVEEGFSPLKISDPLYFMDNLKKSYIPLTKEIYDQIILGKIKL